MPAKLLDVGNCNPDHAMILALLTKHFDVSIDRVMFVEDALKKMKETRYNLVLVNRLIFDDGSDGIALLKKAKSDPSLRDTAIMMISNYEDAQAAAVAAGAEPGFGKAALTSPQTTDRLAHYLPRRK